MEVQSDTQKLDSLWFYSIACGDTMNTNPIVQELSTPSVMEEICSTECVTRLRVLFDIYVFHELVKNCTTESEEKLMALLERAFDHEHKDQMNQLDRRYETVLEVLYKTRPVNCRLLQFFNSWKHDDTEFFECD